MIFLFHLAILFLTLVILTLQIAKTGKKKALIPLIGLLLLFSFHCLYWGAVCTECNLSSETCVIELLIFWLLVIVGVWTGR